MIPEYGVLRKEMWKLAFLRKYGSFEILIDLLSWFTVYNSDNHCFLCFGDLLQFLY